MKTIMHVDMNSFFASCEIAKSKGKYSYSSQLIVTGDPGSRHGIVLAATPSAKVLGLHAGMPLNEARSLCPNGIYITSNMGDYLEYSHKFMKILQYYSPVVESGGIDEAYIDYTGCEQLFGDSLTAADIIRNRVKNELNLTVSIGISYNKLLAKQGSDYKKPDAITVFTQSNFRELLWPRPVSDLMYIGPHTAVKLKNININTIGQLAVASGKVLHSTFGINGILMRDHANGIDNSKVCNEPTPLKSISESSTLPVNICSLPELQGELLYHLEKLTGRLRSINCNTSVVHVSIRDSSLRFYGIQQKLPKPTNITNEIFFIASGLMEKLWNGNKIRQVGASLSVLSPRNSAEQLSLFDTHQREQLHALENCIDLIRAEHGYSSITRCRLITPPSVIKD